MSHAEAVESPPQRRLARKWGRWVVGIPVAWAIGAVAASNLLGGVLALGFVYRWMGWTAERVWWRQTAGMGPFAQPGPRWVFAGGLWANVKTGVAGAFHTGLALLPSAALWMFAWRYGWDNSFTKGYDLRWIGPVTGLLGTALFVITMWGLPLAQARHATTRSWKAFWEIGLLATLVKRSWTGAVPIAVVYALVGIPFTVMWVFPVFAPMANPALSDMTDAELLQWLNGYYLAWAVLGFAAVFVLKVAAARWYAHALLDAVRAGVLTKRQLHPVEADALERYGLLKVKDLSHRHPLVRAADWTASALGRTAGLTAASFLWVFVVVQLFGSMFFHYRPIVGWVNPPLIAIPAFKYIPPGLGEEGAQP